MDQFFIGTGRALIVVLACVGLVILVNLLGLAVAFLVWLGEKMFGGQD